LCLEDIFLNNKKPNSMIFIRPKFNDKTYKIEIDLTVVACRGKLEYPENIKHTFEQDSTAVYNPSNIPLQNRWINKNNNISSSYDRFYIRLNKLHLNDKEIIKPYRTLTYHLMYYDFLNGRTEFKWGKYWNLTFLENVKKEFHIAIVGAFIESSIMMYEPYSGRRRNLSFAQETRKLLIKLLTIPWVLSLIFWFSLICRISYLTPDGNIKSRYLSVISVRKLLKFPDVIKYSP
jgi:hypothetical protein